MNNIIIINYFDTCVNINLLNKMRHFFDFIAVLLTEYDTYTDLCINIVCVAEDETTCFTVYKFLR